MHIYLRYTVKMCYQQKHVYLPLYLIIEIQEKRPWHVVEKSACIRDEYNLFHV